jgi:preprotein translocase subunit YajC
MNFLLQAPPAGGGGDMFLQLIIPIGFMFLIMYFLVMRPQNKERKIQEEMRKSLKKGDRVVTQSGIVAEVRQVKENNEVVLDLDGKATMTILRSTIVQVLTSDKK